MAPPLRTPTGGRSEEIAEALRRDPPPLDDVARARMERHLVQAAEARRAGSGVRAGRVAHGRLGSRSARWVVGVAGVAALAAALAGAFVTGWMMRSDPRVAESGPATGSRAASAGTEPPDAVRAGALPAKASYEAVDDGQVVASGLLESGRAVRTRAAQQWRVQIASSQLDIAPGSEARFERLDDRQIRVRLEAGGVRVQFHPDRPARQRMVIETGLARVEVVGTVFRVEVDRAGDTSVSVERGLVRVVRLRTERASLLRGGESLRVAASGAAPGPGEDPFPKESVPSSGGPPAGAAGPAPGAAPAGAAPGSAAPSGTGSAAGGGNPAGAVPPRESEVAAVGPDRAAGHSSELPDDVRFELADTWIRQGRYAAARHELYAIARSADRGSSRARAWLRVADTYELQQRYVRAAEAYRRASEAGPRTAQGLNALFGLARVRERRLDVLPGARAAYRRYLELAPDGPLSAEARRRLCSLGDSEACR